jgi:hypothetical protein
MGTNEPKHQPGCIIIRMSDRSSGRRSNRNKVVTRTMNAHARRTSEKCGRVLTVIVTTSHCTVSTAQPSLSVPPCKSNIVCCFSSRTRSSLSILFAASQLGFRAATVSWEFTYLASTLASSPSTCNAAFGVTASITKWLSQFGQYSSLRRGCQFPDLTFANKRVSESTRADTLPLVPILCVLSERFLAFLADKSLCQRPS